MKSFTIWINIFIVTIGALVVFILSTLDIQQLLQWKLATVFTLTVLSLLLYKWRNSLRLDEPQVHIQLLDD